MENRSGALAAPGWGRQLQGYWQNPAIKAILTLVFLLGMATLATLGKNISPGLGIPGSSAPLWLVPLILGRAIVHRDGAGVFMGVGVAVLGVPIGINNPFMHNLWLYGLTGLALDIGCRLPKINIATWYGAIIIGILAHLVKFGFIFSASFFSSITKHFLLVGFMQSLALHLVFGIVSGIVAWAFYRAYRLARARYNL